MSDFWLRKLIFLGVGFAIGLVIAHIVIWRRKRELAKARLRTGKLYDLDLEKFRRWVESTGPTYASTLPEERALLRSGPPPTRTPPGSE